MRNYYWIPIYFMLVFSTYCEAQATELLLSKILASKLITPTKREAVCYRKKNKLEYFWKKKGLRGSRIRAKKFSPQRIILAKRTQSDVVQQILELVNGCQALIAADNSNNQAPTPDFENGGLVPQENQGNSFISGPVTFVVSRDICMAPCVVNVRSTTTGLANDDYLNAYFKVRYDSTNVDPNNTNSTQTGFISSHVYTSPGLYDIVMEVKDVSASSGISSPRRVTVLDPEIVYANSTYCFANSGGSSFAGCPTTDSTRRIVTNSFDQAMTFAAGYRRLLFKVGDTFNSAGGQMLAAADSQTLGAFPLNAATSTNRPIIAFNGGDWVKAVSVTNNDNRITNLHFYGLGWTGAVTSPRVSAIGVGSADHTLVMGNLVQRTNDAGMYLWTDSVNTGVFENEISNAGGYGIYGGNISNSYIVRNAIHHLSFPQHGIRIHPGILQNNIAIVGNRITASESFTAIALRGELNNLVVAGNTTDNLIAISPQNSASAEYQSNALVENNIVLPFSPTVQNNGSGSMTMFVNGLVIRNNIIRDRDHVFSFPGHPLVPSSRNVFLYNNTVVNFNPAISTVFMHAATTVGAFQPPDNFVVANNIFHCIGTGMYVPSVISANPQMNVISVGNIYYRPNYTVHFAIGGNLLSLPQYQASGPAIEVATLNANPMFESTDFNSPQYLELAANSPAVDRSIQLSLVTDGKGRQRIQGMIDAGALERQ